MNSGSDDEYCNPRGTGLRSGDFIPSTGDISDEDTFRFLVATDNHLGYFDNNPIREDDSFITFEEILQIAVDKEVDFLLLGGDLFHENKPKPNVLRKAMELCRKYCLGDRPVAFEYVGDPKRDFPNQVDPGVNYYDPNINVALPIFTIHGNHDDPIGTTKTSAVDHLAAAKLVNHFGSWNNLNKVTVSPVLLTKGITKLALYGLGHMKDERLHRLMFDKKVQFVAPEEDSASWFNVFVLHQNRVKHGPKNYIPENYIPGYMDLVIWGHEHECIKDFHDAQGLPKTNIIQPGSSVATSLCPGESVDKHVFLFSVNKRRILKNNIKLQTVRPFVMKDISSNEIFQGAKLSRNATTKERSRYMERYLENVVNRLIEEAEDQLTGHEKQPIKPLIRLRVFHDNPDEFFSTVRFSQKFSEKIANDDILLFKKNLLKREGGQAEVDADEIEELMNQYDDDLDNHVEKIVESYFSKARAEGKTETLLEVLSEKGISEAVKCAVEKEEEKAIDDVIEAQIEKAIGYLISRKATEETIEAELEHFRQRRAEETDQEKKELEAVLNNIRPRGGRTNGVVEEGTDTSRNENDDSPVEIDDDDDYDVKAQESSSSRKGRGSSTRARGRGSRGGGTTRGRGRGRGRGADSSSPMESPSPEPTTTSRSRGGRGKASNATSTSGRAMRQTTLNIRRSPRKGSSQVGMMQFDDDSD